MTRFIVFFFICSALISCKKEEEVDQRAVDDQNIRDYISARGWEAQSTGSGLYYKVDEEGNGNFPTIDSTVTVNYTGKLDDGGIFDESPNGGATFPLTAVIAGWKEGIPLFSVGGSGFLFIPSHLGYGAAGSGSVPGNAVMIFEVELLDIE